MMIEKLFSGIAKTLNGLFGSKKLLPHEQMCLDAWRSSLPDLAQKVLDEQLAAVYLVQRQAAGAKICFYYREGKDMPLFRNDKPNLLAATVVLRSPEGTEGQTLRVKIFVHRGRFFSIEFPKRPERYMQQHHMQSEQLQVAAVEAAKGGGNNMGTEPN